MANEIVKASPAAFDYDRLKAESRVTIKQKTGEIRERMGKAVRNLIEVGERLIEVKDLLGHGQFLRWLEAEFQWSESAAQKMMQVARFAKSVNFTDLAIGPSALYLLAAPSTPAEVRERFLCQSGTAPVTHAEVKAAVAAAKATPVAESEEGSSDDFDPFKDAPESETAPETTPETPTPPPPKRVNNPPAPDGGKGPGKADTAPAGKGRDPEAGTAAEVASAPTDEEGNPLPDDPAIREAFADAARFDRVESLFTQATADVNYLLGVGATHKEPSAGGRGFNGRWAKELADKFADVKSILKAHRPHALCPYPHGKHKCEACKGLGWLVESVWKEAPENFKATQKSRLRVSGGGRAA